MNAEQDSGEQYEKKIADEPSESREARVPNCCLALCVVKTSSSASDNVSAATLEPAELADQTLRPASLTNHLGAHADWRFASAL